LKARLAYADTSALVAVFLKEPGYEGVMRELAGLDSVYSSCLMEAEIRSVASREKLGEDGLRQILSPLKWVCPDRPLSPEIRSVLQAGRLRGSDAWHLACALYLFGEPGGLPFLTLDRPQAKVAKALGFTVRLP
jgi:predicted nucleic acid-binding protein